MLTDKDVKALEVLSGNIQNLPESTQAFARSLLRQAKNKGDLTHKQVFYLHKVSKESVGEFDTIYEAGIDMGSLGIVCKMFNNAERFMKFPTLRLALENGNRIRIKPATPKSRYKSCFHISTSGDKWPLHDYFGRIDIATNTFYQSRKFNGAHDIKKVVELLQIFVADPVGTIEAHGKHTGVCCLCNKALYGAERKNGKHTKCRDVWGLLV